jgi:hypothetical protein
MMRKLFLRALILIGCVCGCSDNEHEKLREEMNQIADQSLESTG